MRSITITFQEERPGPNVGIGICRRSMEGTLFEEFYSNLFMLELKELLNQIAALSPVGTIMEVKGRGITTEELKALHEAHNIRFSKLKKEQGEQ